MFHREGAYSCPISSAPRSRSQSSRWPLPGGAAAKAAKPKHTVDGQYRLRAAEDDAENLSRKCGKSQSSIKIRTRRTSHPTKSRIRTDHHLLQRRDADRLHIQRPTSRRRSQAVPGASPGHAAAAPGTEAFRLTLLHNNDGESKYVVGDSIVNYGGITRFKTVLDTPARRRGTNASSVPANGQGHGRGQLRATTSSPGLNLRASFQRFDTGVGRRSMTRYALAAIGYDAITIGNHEYDFGPARLAQLIVRASSAASRSSSANTDFTAEPALQALRNNGPDRRLGRRRQGRPADRHHRRLAAETSNISSPRT